MKKATTFPVILQARKDLDMSRPPSGDGLKGTLTPGKDYEILGIDPNRPDYYRLVADNGEEHGLLWSLFTEK